MSSRLRVVVLSPEVELVNKEADFIALPAHAGEMGVLPKHAPLVAKLGSGEVRIKEGSNTERHFVSGGYVQVRSNEVYVLTESAIAGTELDADALAKELSAAEGLPATTSEEAAARRAAIAVARAKQKIQRASN